MGKQWKQCQTLFFWAPKSLQMVIAAMKLKCLLLGRKLMTNLDSILKTRDITSPTKVRLVKAMVFPVVMYGCDSWTSCADHVWCHTLIMCREPGRHSTLDKGHEEGGSAYGNAGSSLRSPPGCSRASPPQKITFAHLICWSYIILWYRASITF